MTNLTELTEPVLASEDDASQLPTPEEAAEAQRYSAATLKCTLADMALDLAVITAMAVVVGPLIDRWLAGFAWLSGEQSLVRLAALGAAITALHSLVSLPLSFYGGYVVEHRFGLSNQSRSAWLKTWLKNSGLALVMLAAIYTGLYAIIWSAGGYWWLVAAPVFYVASAVSNYLLPVLVLPLFYKSEPLNDASLDQRLSELAAGSGLTIEGVFRLELSSETKKANAMLAGMGSTRRVLLGDTLLNRFSPNEIDVVVAHELGHHVRRHLPKLMAFAAVTAMAGFFTCHVVLSNWVGTDPRAWPTESLPKVALVLTVFSMLVGPLQNLVSRKFEREADRYAIDRTGDRGAFRSAFLKLARMNKAELDPNPIEVLLLHSHPPIRERLALVGALPEM